MKLDEKMGWEKRPAVALEVVKALAACAPRDGGAAEFARFKFLRVRITTWCEVERICREIAADVATRLLGG
jgi:hypothetical protein